MARFGALVSVEMVTNQGKKVFLRLEEEVEVELEGDVEGGRRGGCGRCGW